MLERRSPTLTSEELMEQLKPEAELN